MKDTPPRIHTLRNDGETPKTSDCFTPRTMEGNDGAFKSTKYGSTIEGPYRAPGLWFGRIMWAAFVIIVVGILIMLFVKK